MEGLMLAALLVIGLCTLVSVILQFVSWHQHNGLVGRVMKLEALQENTLTHAETIRIYERLSSIESSVSSLGDSVRSIQRHLLENDQ